MPDSARLFGLETEYALSAFDARGGRLAQDVALHRFTERARERLVWLPAQVPGGLFLENGSLLYCDMGHPELATPEVSNPWDAVGYQRAGDRIVAALAADLARAVPLSGVCVAKAGVDYASGATWGAHESYGCRRPPRDLAAELLPHLVTRVLYTGAGGFRPESPGIEFSLSPRAGYLREAVGEESTHRRGIFHTRDEPLVDEGGYHRIHLICGESLCSQTADFLRVGATALVVALGEAGASPGGAMRLRCPVAALAAVAADPRCRVPLDLAGGGRLTAIEIQRRYLAAVEQRVGEPGWPDWAPAVCRIWGGVLDRLEGGSGSLSRILDWRIKLALYTRYLEREGWSWEEVAFWNADSAQERRGLQAAVRRNAFRSLRGRLFELDTRFAQLEGGLFGGLDAQGVLDHGVPGIPNTSRAAAEPPGNGRAARRGEWVRRLASQAHRYVCDWHGISDRQMNLWLSFPLSGSPVEWEASSP